MEFALLAFFTLFASFSSSLALSRSKGACLLQVENGPCRGEIERYYYNTVTQKCEIFYYGGCQGNANNFNSYQECQKACFRIPKIPQICRFPKEAGHCRGLFPRYFFNMTTMQCESFYYGGCGGNTNRFNDLPSCLEYCSPKKSYYSCALSGPSGQREVFGLYNAVLLQHGHQDVRGVCLLGLRRKQQQLCVTAELCGRVCSRTKKTLKSWETSALEAK
ncbi:tissue factor pathway inhibitor 2 isoform X2 [Xiphophorus hellerii]|uniref:tissue factor pathway inhibitor 2 isoform X2 n=1 Tax=Xiphophorus hellerii TaxID=8084 RepID=UPI0013B3C4C0|nr:tissue factor pathway inhibitor 2 isoform X2 [Xiphophorus hellerii]